jgi:hypothetical protein
VSVEAKASARASAVSIFGQASGYRAVRLAQMSQFVELGSCPGSTAARRFEEPSRQVTVPVHGPTHHHVSTGHFVKENVLLERTKDEEEPPIAQAWMIETAARSRKWMLPEQVTETVHVLGSKVPGSLETEGRQLRQERPVYSPEAPERIRPSSVG